MLSFENFNRADLSDDESLVKKEEIKQIIFSVICYFFIYYYFRYIFANHNSSHRSLEDLLKKIIFYL